MATTIHRGNSTQSRDISYTFDGKHLFKGSSTQSRDIVYTIQGYISIGALFTIL